MRVAKLLKIVSLTTVNLSLVMIVVFLVLHHFFPQAAMPHGEGNAYLTVAILVASLIYPLALATFVLLVWNMVLSLKKKQWHIPLYALGCGALLAMFIMLKVYYELYNAGCACGGI